MSKKPQVTKPAKTNKKAPGKTVGPSLKMIEFTPAKAAEAIAAAGATKTGKLFMVPFDMIKVVPGYNIRITDTEEYRNGIAELAESIKTEGFYDTEPLSCFPTDIDGEACLVLTNGHRRFEAAKKAVAEGYELDKLPVVLDSSEKSAMDLQVAMDKKNSGVQPNMMERAVLAHRMIRDGLSEEDVAKRLNKTVRYVKDLRVIIGAPREVRELIKHGKISGYEAIAQLRKDPTGASIIAAAEKAEAAAAAKAEKGKVKLTKATMEGGGEKKPREKMETLVFNFSAKAGEEFLLEDAEPFASLIGAETEDDWYRGTRSTKKKISLIDVTVECKVRRPKTAEALAEEAEEAAKQDKRDAKKSPARGQKAPANDGLGDDDDSLGLDDEDDAPDLRSLGIAEPRDEASL